MPNHDSYENPLAVRYASPEMVRIFSPQKRYSTWRRIWLALAESQSEMGLPIAADQLAALRAAVDQIDFEAADRYERKTRHDVMAHIHAFADAAPAARGIIHLGATSMDIVDNADLMLMREALDLLFGRLVAVIAKLADFCDQYADLPTLGYTHLQPAQLTTVGKRAALWLGDLQSDAFNILRASASIHCRGLRGATGTQASFLKLLSNGSPSDDSPSPPGAAPRASAHAVSDPATRVADLESRFAAKLGFSSSYPVVGQTYSRKVDVDVVFALASFAASVQKTCNDLRLLAMLKEIEEPFESTQVGSSAMPYKRNPARAERATSLARFLVSLSTSPPMTLAAQMFERTLDDSANKRLVIPEAFLTADALCVLLHDIFSGLVVYPATIAARITAELPFIATEDILMEAVSRGGDRQALHEKIRQHAQAAGQQVKAHAQPNDLIARLKSDPAFSAIDWTAAMNPSRYTGLAALQTHNFVRDIRENFLKMFSEKSAPPPKVHL